MCKDFLAGRCQKGERCIFAHSQEELRQHAAGGQTRQGNIMMPSKGPSGNLMGPAAGMNPMMGMGAGPMGMQGAMPGMPNPMMGMGGMNPMGMGGPGAMMGGGPMGQTGMGMGGHGMGATGMAGLTPQMGQGPTVMMGGPMGGPQGMMQPQQQQKQQGMPGKGLPRYGQRESPHRLSCILSWLSRHEVPRLASSKGFTHQQRLPETRFAP